MEISRVLEEVSSKISEKQRELLEQNLLIEQIEKKKCDLQDQIVQLNLELNQRQQVIGSESKSLVIYGKRRELDLLKGQRWFYSDKTTINTNLSIQIQNTQQLFSSSTEFDHPPFEPTLLLGLKRLFVTESIDRRLWKLISFVNQLKDLEELELGALFDECERPYEFSVGCPKLRSLAIGKIRGNVTIVIKSKIVRFKTHDYLSNFKFKHPEVLREMHLMLDACQKWLALRFANLEVFKCANGITEESCKQLIEHSTGLRDLQLGLSHNLAHYDCVEQSVWSALQLKTAFGRSELSIGFYGLKLESREEFSAFHLESGGSRKLIKLLMKNYTKLTDLAWVEQVDYNYLVDSVAGELPNDFHQKLSNIKELHVHGNVADPARLLGFLRNCKSLRCLSIENSSLDGLFYREIDFSSIKKLKIYESASKIQDFRFIWQLNNLDYFQAILKRPVSMVQRGLDYLRDMTGAEAGVKGKFIMIVKDYKAGFELKIDNSAHTKIYTAQELIEELAKVLSKL